jgi:multidrug efflux system membrane fusion protein
VAVQRGPQGAFVYVAKGDQAELRPVAVERIEGEDALIAQGLAPGDEVVREGQGQLRPGARLALREAAKGAGPAPTGTGAAPSPGSGGPAGGKHQGHQPL